jgi:hypothetical protein
VQLLLLLVGWDFWYCGHYWPIVPAPDDGDCGEIGGMKIGRGKYSEKTCSSAILSTTNPTWLDPGLNPGCRGGKSATNRLSYGAATHYTQLKSSPPFYEDATEPPAAGWLWHFQTAGFVGPTP